MLKKGTVREDGKIYWCSSKRKGEIWLTKEQYDKYDETVRNYRRKSHQAYYARREKIKPSDRSYFGKYDPAANKYFAKISTSGKEIWVTKAELERLKKQSKLNRRKYVERQQSLPDNKIKVGDQHPTDKTLYVIYKVGKKPMYGSKEKLEERRKSRKKTMCLRNIKYNSRRREFIENLGGQRFKRGYFSIEKNMVFWEYSTTCREIWISEEKFHKLRNAHLQRRKVHRMKAKALQPSSNSGSLAQS